MHLIQAKLREDDSRDVGTPLCLDWVTELLEVCLRSTYISYGSEFYEQREGATFGFLVSVVVSNLYMEELALKSAQSRRKLWNRYVDDTCCILTKGDMDRLLHHLKHQLSP